MDESYGGKVQKYELELRLGLFLNGCSPGGGASNMWTHLLDGSLDLSIMMTTVSTLLSFATVPLWVLTLGPVILASGNFVIPFGDIIITVVSLIFPCVVGIALQYFFPKVIPYCKKVLSPFSIFILVFIFTVGVYAYRYTFSIITWKSILAGLLLPLLGYILGLILAGIFRQSWKKCIAISIETGVQNTTIAVIILNVAIPPPVSNIATGEYIQ
ncbi:hypothetical protein SK128_006850 [Halocaridina rubra]|uniref:Uncharacterized protein n=1 Tax=Halocaridina rubra TaxID=373956 RepID=A0AAN9A172_HALRR